MVLSVFVRMAAPLMQYSDIPKIVLIFHSQPPIRIWNSKKRGKICEYDTMPDYFHIFILAEEVYSEQYWVLCEISNFWSIQSSNIGE